ncbi:ferrous iron efflux protein F [compost metagenome]
MIAKVSGVQEVKDIKARNYGNNEVIDVIIVVDADTEFQKAHEIATQVEEELKKVPVIYEVNVHYEPAEPVEDQEGEGLR